MINQTTKFKNVKLSDYAQIFPGYAFKSERFTDLTSDVPLIKGENVQQGYINWAASKYWPRNEASGFEKYYLRDGDIVLAMDRPWVTSGLKWAYIKKYDSQSLLVQRVARLRAKKGLDQVFLRCLISSSYFSNYIQPIVTGVNVPHISPKQIGDFQIPLPHINYQRKIAAILSAYDDLIENNKRRIALLEKMAEEIYREWFVRFRFPGYKKVKFVKGMPQGWEITSLGEIATFTMGQSPKSEFYNQISDGLPFNQGVGTYGQRFPKKLTFCNVNGRKAKQGDILFSVRAPVGRLNIADCEMIIGRGLAAIRHKKDLNSYLYYLLKVAFSNEDIIGNGAIFNSVGRDELKMFKILQPNATLDAKFNEIAVKIDEQISLLINSLDNLNKTRDMLLPRLVSGKLSVENLDIQFPPSMREEIETDQQEAAYA